MYANDDCFEKWMQKRFDEVRDIAKYLKASHGAKEVFGETAYICLPFFLNL
jgi:hypothetical protein